jgi:hypothetical protein
MEIVVFGEDHTHERSDLLEIDVRLHELCENALHGADGGEELAGEVLDSAPRARGEEQLQNSGRSHTVILGYEKEQDADWSRRSLIEKCLPG